MRVVVTGATGNIGSAVVRWLTGHPSIDSVVGIARHPPAGEAHDQPARVRWQPADIGGRDAVDRLTEVFSAADAVVHVAWRILADRDRAAQERTNRHGSSAVVEAVRRAGVGQLAFLSSSAVYSPAPPGMRVREDWPRNGIPGSVYSADKVAVEELLDRLQVDEPGLRVTRVRPPTVLQTSAARELTAMTLGRLAPLARLTGGRLPLLPLPPSARAQVVAAQEVAEVVGRALLAGASGAYNVADDPVLVPADIARLLGGRHLPAPAVVPRTLLDISFRLRLQRVDPSWIDVLLGVPLLDCAKARDELGWSPGTDSRALLTRMRAAVAEGRGAQEPPLQHR